MESERRRGGDRRGTGELGERLTHDPDPVCLEKGVLKKALVKDVALVRLSYEEDVRAILFVFL